MFGSSFGDLIRPSVDPSSEPRSCGQTACMPAGMDYLAAPLSVLLEISRGYSNCEGACLQLGASIYWTDTASAFEKCKCLHSPCTVHVARFQSVAKTWPQTLRKKRQKPCHVDVFAQYPRGAVIFGYRPAQRNKSRLSKRKAESTPDDRPTLRRSACKADSGVDVSFDNEAASSSPASTGPRRRSISRSWGTMESWKVKAAPKPSVG